MTRNHMVLTFPSLAENESFARVAVAAFAVQLSPTLSEIADLKTAVSEAVTNAIVHGYEGCRGEITLRVSYDDRGEMTVEIEDHGRGIPDVAQAMEPFYTTQPEQERSGMGFSVMQTFMDDLEVVSHPGEGTLVRMRKKIAAGSGRDLCLHKGFRYPGGTPLCGSGGGSSAPGQDALPPLCAAQPRAGRAVSTGLRGAHEGIKPF